MTRKLLFLWAMLLSLFTSVNAQNWTWTGETAAAGDFYLYNVGFKGFLNYAGSVSVSANNTPTSMWKFSNASSGNISTSYNNKTYYIYVEKTGTGGSASIRTNTATVTIAPSSITSGAYKIQHTKTGIGSGTRYFNVENATKVSAASTNGVNNDWYLISEAQKTAHDNYIVAWTKLNALSSINPSMPKAAEVSNALAAATNYDNAAENTKTLNDLLTACFKAATKENPLNVTMFITNPGYEASTWNDGWTADNFGHQNNGKMNVNYAEMWSAEGTLTSGKISQTLHNLPVGTYNLSATVTGGFVGETSMYAMEEARKVVVPGIEDDPVQHPVVPFVIHNDTEGQNVEIGFKRDDCQYWTAVDDWTLSYYPVDEYEYNNGIRLDGSYLSKPAYTGTPMEGVDPQHDNDALLVVTWRDNSTNDLEASWALAANSKAEVWVDGAKTADADLLTDFRSSHYDNGFGLYIPNFDETKTYTVKVPENVFGYTAVGHGNEAFEINAVQSPLKDGKYFVVVKGTGKHVSRGKGFGTQAILDYYGVPMLVQTAGLTTFKFLDNNAFLGSEPSDDWLFTDIQGSEGNKVRRYVLIAGEGAHEGEFQFYAPARDKYLSHVQNSIEGESYDAVNEGGNADYFQFEVLDAEGYATHLAKIEEDEAIRVAAHAGFVVKNKAEYDELISKWETQDLTTIFPSNDTEATKAAEYHEKKNAELACDAIWKCTPRDLVGGEKVKLTLDKGLYVMDCDAFQQAMDLATLQANQGFRGLTYMYVKVGSEMYKSQLKSITETTGTIPTDEASATTALDAGTYRNQVIFYVPEKGTTVEFGVENPQRLGNGVDETAGSWVAFKNIKVEKFNAELDEANLTCKAGMYGTFVAPFDVIIPDDIMVMDVQLEYDNRIVVIERALTAGDNSKKILPAGIPVIVKNTSDQDIIDKIYRDVKTVEDETVTDNNSVLTGSLVTNHQIRTGSFVLQTQEGLQAFYIVVDEKPFICQKNRCYVKTSGSQGGGQAKVLNIIESDEANGIHEVESANSNKPETTAIYDLSGRRVTTTQKGIYIINGKKVVKY
ncbi:MAG: hypothetical protein MJZ29_08460 [Bacteroidaceae bacterium]|nr:hypothetical protein [Bacteroidaceae bacterium]